MPTTVTPGHLSENELNDLVARQPETEAAAARLLALVIGEGRALELVRSCINATLVSTDTDGRVVILHPNETGW
jgi:hypothetical protein